ncbi:G patch domain-containing protein TGH-like [Chenopodium quinoa]|uniref:G patch domain-containing protein TGH-like n=1 Tax=Chenopodium quinoa TaxID=63459 RepID=UPI000B781188|nr:G patch domain-containing protein TGH-like [Chenopodium quinoa]
MDSDEEDFVFFGTPIEREEDLTTRKKKALAESSSQLRTLPSWKQEVRDEEGRRRFHGAFTGGYSAGFYNTVGSKEGWAPQSFTSSRKNRAEAKKQSILDFLDDDEKDEMGGQVLGTSSQFDTFGFTAAELSRKQVEKEQKQRPSIIPGPVPDELVIPATESIGVKLLLKMGWRHGRSIKDSSINSLHEARREARKAFMALSSADKTSDMAGSEPHKNGSDDLMEELATDDVQSTRSTPVYVRQPKQDLYGLGYDPYKHAPEFREMKRSRLSGNNEIGYRKTSSSRQEPLIAKSGKLASGFGIGALEEYDVEDEDIYSSGHDNVETYLPNDDDELLRLEMVDGQKAAEVNQGFGLRFRVASNSDYQLERFDPPIIPKDFVPQHKFPAPLETNLMSDPPPPEVAPPADNNLKVMIEGVAALVARCGKLFEDISREKNQTNPLFSFLNGGSGHDYYARKLWEAQQKCNGQIRMRPDEKLHSVVQKLTAESRGKILGERPLERTLRDSSSVAAAADDDNDNVQSSLSDTFIKPEVIKELLETAKTYKDDPAKQERFEQFLKDKYQGGLRVTDTGKSAYMSEDARARERLDFEAAAEAIQKSRSANQSKLSGQQSMDFTMATGMQFTSGGIQLGKEISTEELVSKKIYPKREEFQWRPAPLLCKRFDIVDPFMGKPPPAPRIRGKVDSLIFAPDTAKIKKTEDVVISNELSMDMSSKEAEVSVEIENIERPIDLYKAIFSDDSDNEEEVSALNEMEDPQKKTEAASAAFSRIVAGDFLESLGKELGLEVPPDLPSATTKAGISAPHKDVTDIQAKDLPSPPALGTVCEVWDNITLNRVVDDKERAQKESPIRGKDVITPISQSVSNKKLERADRGNRKKKYESSSSSSEGERSRKRSRKHHRRHSSSDDDASDDSRSRHSSRSRDDKRRSPRKKHRRRKHSRHR